MMWIFFDSFIDKIVNRNINSGKVKTKLAWLIALYFSISSCQILSLKNDQTNAGAESASAELRVPASALSIGQVVPQQCSRNKMYLEEQLSVLPAEYLRLHGGDNADRIPVRCIQLAQRNFSGHYGICESEESRPQISSTKPCLTDRYVTLVYNAYHDVMDCFSLDPREFYLQIMVESGFHINAINRSGFDSGMAQFTANGIKKVMANNLIERTRRALLESSRPSCQRISSIVGTFNQDAVTVEKRCAMLTLPKNPYRAMLFNYLHTMRDQLAIDRLLTDFPEMQAAFTPRIRRQFVYMAYNRGLTGLKNLLKSYSESRQFFGQQVLEADLDLNKNLSRAKKIMQMEPHKRELLRRARVRNLSFAEHALINGASYLSDMSAARDFVQQHMGNSCGEL